MANEYTIIDWEAVIRKCICYIDSTIKLGYFDFESVTIFSNYEAQNVGFKMKITPRYVPLLYIITEKNGKKSFTVESVGKTLDYLGPIIDTFWQPKDLNKLYALLEPHMFSKTEEGIMLKEFLQGLNKNA